MVDPEIYANVILDKVREYEGDSDQYCTMLEYLIGLLEIEYEEQ